MFKNYRRTNVAEMRPYVYGENMTNISVSKEDVPRMDIGMVARNPMNHNDQWYVARQYFQDNFEEMVGQGAMSFGHAIEAAKLGHKIARAGWNGKNMFLFYNPASDVTVSEGRPLAAALPVGTPVHMSPYIMMKTADTEMTCVPWLASQTDILADDWVIV